MDLHSSVCTQQRTCWVSNATANATLVAQTLNIIQAYAYITEPPNVSLEKTCIHIGVRSRTLANKVK